MSLAGSILAAVGFTFAFFATSILQLYVLISIIAGIYSKNKSLAMPIKMYESELDFEIREFISVPLLARPIIYGTYVA